MAKRKKVKKSAAGCKIKVKRTKRGLQLLWSGCSPAAKRSLKKRIAHVMADRL